MSTEYKIVEGVDVDDWIGGVSYLQAEHTIHRNPALAAQYQPLMDKIAALEAERDRLLGPRTVSRKAEESLGEEAPASKNAGEESLVGGNPLIREIHEGLNALYEEAEALWALYSEDVEVWTLRRLDENEAADILKSVGGIPDAPTPPAPSATDEAKKAYDEAFGEWYRASQEVNRELNLRCLAASVLKVVVKGKEVAPPTREGLDKVLARPGGQRHIHDLIQVMENLTTEGPTITAPHRPGA